MMANRTGMLINDIQIFRLLEISLKSKERFKLIVDTQSFDQQDDNGKVSFNQTIKDIDKKIVMLRCQKNQLRVAM